MSNRKLKVTEGVLLAALLTLAPHAAAQDRQRAPLIVRSYCSGCHAIDGNAELPYFPKLSGLDSVYAQKRLKEFQQPGLPPVDELFTHPRDGAGTKMREPGSARQEVINMQGVAHAVRPQLITQALDWYSRQPRAAGRSANKALAEQGRLVFSNGPREQKSLACVSCHGSEAEGHGFAPRLAGQNAGYMEAQLARFRRGDQRGTPEMIAVARELNSDEAHATAVYLASK
jgi:cytochrome c553